MKINRYKKVNKNLGFYVNNFGFRQPYQLLVDGTFCFAALNNKINIADNIPRYLQGEIKLLTTQCAIIEMESLGSKLFGALLILKQYGIHKCGHEGKPVPGSLCFSSMLNKQNENHYIIATQDRDLQNKVRNIAGVPLLYLHIKTPVLEQPSDISVQFAKDKMAGIGESERKALIEMKIKNGVAVEEVRRFKKKKKGVNPLSCKKKKKSGVVQKLEKNDAIDTEKKKRKKVRIPKHVKELLKNKVVDA